MNLIITMNELDFYLGKKKEIKVSLRGGVVSQLTETLEQTYCTV